MRKQAYVLPIGGQLPGWAVQVYGDEVIEDGTIVPLPITDRVPFEEALRFVEGLPIGDGAIVDGWATWREMDDCGEHELRAIAQAG